MGGGAMSHPVGSAALEPAVIVPIAAAAVLYARGFLPLRHRLPARFGPGRAVVFGLGLASLLAALGPPLEALARRSLTAHMIQHMVVMMVAPPLLWLGAPVAPLLLGLPRWARRAVVEALAWRPIRSVGRALAQPAVGWAAFVVAFWAWHVPALYDAALRSDSWHHVEHACFLTTALLFWRPVILAWPARSPWPRWAMIPYLVLADLQNSVLAAILTFSDRVIYLAYAAVPPLSGLSALEDQSIAGVIMWVPGSLVFLVPVVWLVATELGPRRFTADGGA